MRRVSKSWKYRIGRLAEKCAFEATCQIVYSSLRSEPENLSLDSGDLIRTYRKPNNEDDWVVWWHQPSRHHSYRKKVSDLPDVVVYRNHQPIVAIEVKNWNPRDKINSYQLVKEMVKRFLSVPNTIPCVVLSSSTNFRRPEQCLSILRDSHIEIRLFRHRPLRNTDLKETTTEMRQILEPNITPERLMGQTLS